MNPSKMDNLWKKEKVQGNYVDLFASVKNPYFDIYLQSVKAQHTRKNNQKSTEWRSKGNELFRQENWLEAAICYIKSLCFAEVGTENVALAYSNRSACYFHMRLYNEVLMDIELAKNANLPDRLLPKLEQRKKESKLMSMLELKEEFQPRLSYKADRNIPCMANVVEIKYNEKFGRHLIAKSDIPVGKIVLVENDIPRIRDEPSVCHSCLRLCMNCMACPNCPDVVFCSVDCMNNDQIHKFECGTFFPHLQPQGRIYIKILLLATTSFPDVDSLMQFVESALLEQPETLPTSLNDPKSKYNFFLKLSTSAPYAQALTEAHKVYKIMMDLPKVSGLFDSARKKRFLMHLVMHHILVYNSNAFKLGDSQYVATVSSLMNHSCAPNIISCALKNYVIGMTGRPIRKGEQLFNNYSLELCGKPSNERKAELKSRWGFDCKCERCEPTRAPIDRKMTTSDPCYKYVVKNQQIVDVRNQTESAIIKKKCIEFLNKYGRSAWSPEIELVFNVFADYFANAL
ncbi:SET and MYND domain-containing protein 4-like [Sitodiplosis mosellana]|uniref:SET and MYND domain-containing protein 4-like n=1 Tax=Sitodiplosis mosellana TaxID=263140 RepID=UPI0024449F8B|nr:SET and MYND domain-containing protein 4-like [Sitodiplosis mosellana]